MIPHQESSYVEMSHSKSLKDGDASSSVNCLDDDMIPDEKLVLQPPDELAIGQKADQP